MLCVARAFNLYLILFLSLIWFADVTGSRVHSGDSSLRRSQHSASAPNIHSLLLAEQREWLLHHPLPAHHTGSRRAASSQARGGLRDPLAFEYQVAVDEPHVMPSHGYGATDSAQSWRTGARPVVVLQSPSGTAMSDVMSSGQAFAFPPLSRHRTNPP